jgi:tetratricopeptide (TPR) repeat protein
MAALTIEQALQAAVGQHQAGHLAAAEAIYRQILAVQPNHPEALHLLGAVALVSGRYVEALDLIGRALTISPNHPIYESNLGEAYRRLGRLDEAIVHLRRAVALQPDYVDALNNLGSSLAQMEQWGEAMTNFQRASALRPEDTNTLNNLALAWMKQGCAEEAAACYRRVITLDANSAEAHHNLAEALLKGRHWDEAIACEQRAVTLRPVFMEAYGNLAVALLAKDRHAEAIACNERGLALKPDSPELWTNLAAAFVESGQHDKALHACERALAIDPDFAPAHWARSLMLLRAGRFEEGWQEYEWRWKTTPLSTYRRRFPAPQWDGTPAADQTILAHAEQGYGDAIQFLRYALLLRERIGAGRLILECGRPLVRLFASAIGADTPVFPRETWDGNELPPFDRHIPWHSLPLTLGTFEPLQMGEPYLHADPELRAIWRERIGEGRAFRVGLAWTGNPDYARLRHRSIAPENLLPLLRLPDVRFYSLQVDTRGGAPQELMEAGLIDLTPHITDFADTAALVAELDLIISTDGATVHLAGALGQPVWTLLPFVPDWRWGLEGEQTPWYPTMRLFRQPAMGDWDSVLRHVEKLCAEAAAAGLQSR